jgi:hypothetical protein
MASVDGFALRLDERATLAPAPGGWAYGMVITLTHDELGKSVAAYRPEPVAAQLQDGSSAPELCFNLPTIPQTGETNPDYAIALRAVAKKMGLPEQYEAEIGG